MADFFIYIAKSTLCLVLFYFSFKVVLSKETFFRFNRFVLLVGMTICTLLPLIEYETSYTSFLQTPFTQLEKLTGKEEKIESLEFSSPEIFNYKQTIEERYSKKPLVTISPLPNEISKNPVVFTKEKPLLSLIQLTGIFYSIGFIGCLIFLIISISRMVRVIRKGKKIRQNRDIIVLTKEKICPFSWCNYIVLNENDYRSNPEEIITHEKIHARRLHALDLIFAELFVLLHWFNPVVWLLKRELQNVHEYEADMGVINQGIDATKYQLLLVKKAVGSRSYAIANSFNHSKIKNRITMMLKEKSTRWARLKLLVFVPLAVATLQSFAHPEPAGRNESLNNSESTKKMHKVDKDFGNPDFATPHPDAKGNKKDLSTTPSSPQASKSKGEMTERQKAAVKEYEAAAKKFESLMNKQATDMEKIANSEMAALTKDFEIAAKKFESEMKRLKIDSKDVSQVPEMKAAEEEFKVASEKFNQRMNEIMPDITKLNNDEGVKAARDEFEAASEKFESIMKEG